MKVTPTIMNGGRVAPVWFEPKGLCNSQVMPCVYIGERMMAVHAEAIDDLIKALTACRNEYRLYMGWPTD